MRYIICLILGLALCLGSYSPTVFAAGDSSQEPNSEHYLSPDVPLQSYVYDYLEKFDGLGYLKDMRGGTKPYTRLQVAKWIEQIDSAVQQDPDTPAYALNMLSQLKTDFSAELATLNGSNPTRGIELKEMTINPVYYNGATLTQKGVKASLQPLNTNNDGYRFPDGTSAFSTFLLEGSLNDHLVVSMTPRVSFDPGDTSATMEADYLKTNINNLEIQVGKEPMWWGEGLLGTRSFTDNAPALTSVKITNIDPMSGGFLGLTYITVLYSVLGDRTDVQYPSFVGFRGDFTPGENLTFGLNRMDIVGGQGYMLTSSDIWNFLLANNSSDFHDDKWDSEAGGDFRWRLPDLQGMQLYGEVYGEDQSHVVKIIPFPSELSELVGLYIPRLSESGDWDAHVEWAHTRPSWYVHSLFTDGWTNEDNLMGDAMGPDALRYYLEISRYMPDNLQLSVNFERLIQEFSTPDPQKINSVWLTAQKEVSTDVYVSGSFGIARVDNEDFQLGQQGHNYIASIGITKKFN